MVFEMHLHCAHSKQRNFKPLIFEPIQLLRMKTIIINVPDKDENRFTALMKKLGFKQRVLTEDEREEMALAKWIEEGWESEEVPESEVLQTLRKHGVEV